MSSILEFVFFDEWHSESNEFSSNQSFFPIDFTASLLPPQKRGGRTRKQDD